MDINKYLIIINDKEKTTEIEKIDTNSQSKIVVKFYGNETVYTYKKENILVLNNPNQIEPNDYLIYLNDICLFGISKIVDFTNYVRISYDNGRISIYRKNKLKFVKNSLSDKKSKKVLEYLKNIAQNVDSENDFLHNQYEKVKQLNENSILSKYLNPKAINKSEDKELIIFPFGFNLSQETATANALTSQVSIIEGPPGTGKTQTILNILANIVIDNKTVAVVSNNNTAIMNVFEKLESYELSFISAFLGKKENKLEFIKNQKSKYPRFTDTKNTINKLKKEIIQDTSNMKKMLSVKNKLALSIQELEELSIEKIHFNKLYNEHIVNPDKNMALLGKNSEEMLLLWADFEQLEKRNKKINLFFKIKLLIKYGVFTLKFYKYSLDQIILFLQNSFYFHKEKELQNHITKLEKTLHDYNFDQALNEHRTKSMNLFKLSLSKRYNLRNQRKIFSDDSLLKEFTSFIREYPVILSTTHSLRNCTGQNYLYDYLIIDEASQVDIVSGALSLSCAKNVIVVGDLKQLPHIVNSKSKNTIESIFNSYALNKAYHYTNNFLFSMSTVFKDAPKTLLKEHYRCHPKIIGFCNKKFYNNELVILTKEKKEADIPLFLYNTTPGNHARGKYNQRQVDVISSEILPNIECNDIGIISPFRDQVNKLNSEVGSIDGIAIDTVHKFQGREKNIVIITTVVDKENEFADDSNLLNVAISRAVDTLYVVVSDNEKNNNMKDLVNYIKYNNLEIRESSIYSIFDLLYKNYAPFLNQYLKKMKNESEYKSENLMNIIIEKVLGEVEFQHLDKIAQISLNRIIKDTSLLLNDELKFVNNSWSHLDFLIYNKVSKETVLAIEVDGYAFHENNPEQLKRDKLKDNILLKYNIPIIRFTTNGSEEERKLTDKLNMILFS